MVMSRLRIPTFEDLLKKVRQPKIPAVSANVTLDQKQAGEIGYTLAGGWKLQNTGQGISLLSPRGNVFNVNKINPDGKVAGFTAVKDGRPVKIPPLPPPEPIDESVRQQLKDFEVKRGNISASVTPSEIFPKPFSVKGIVGPEPGFEKGYRTAEDIQRQRAIPKMLGVPEIPPPAEFKLPGPRRGIGFALDILTGRKTTENPKGLTPIEYAQTIPLAEAAISGIPAAVTLGAAGYQGLKEATDLLLRASIMRNLSMQSAARGVDITKERAEAFANELTSALSRRFSMGQNWKNIFDFARGKYVPKPEAVQETENMAKEAVSRFLVPQGTQTGAMAFGGLPGKPTKELGQRIAGSLGIKFDGIQKGTANIPDKMQFTDPQTGSTTYGNTLEEVKANIDTMRAKFESAKKPQVESPEGYGLSRTDVKDILERTYNQVKQYYEPRLTFNEWVNQTTDAVSLEVDSNSDVYQRYLKNLPEGVHFQDVLDAYKAGQLPETVEKVSKAKPITIPGGITAKPIGGLGEPKPVALQTQEQISEAWSKAIGRAKAMGDAVTKARKDIFLTYTSDANLATKLGITQSALNQKIRQWSGYPVNARMFEDRINQGKELPIQWHGLRNSAFIVKQQARAEDVDKFVKQVIVNDPRWATHEGEWLRSYIVRAFLGIDTRILFRDLTFQIDSVLKPRGQYTNQSKLIRIRDNNPHTVTHEIGHYLDHKWAEEFYPNSAVGASSLLDSLNISLAAPNASPERIQWMKNFNQFVLDISSRSEIGSEYYQDRGEVFARFTAKFVDFVNKTAGQPTWGGNQYLNDRFTSQDFTRFIQLLQEKTYVDILDGNPLGNKIKASYPQATDMAEDVTPAPLHQALIQEGEQLIQQAEKINAQDANLQSFKAAVEKAKGATDTESRTAALREMEKLETEVQKIGEKPTEQPPSKPPPPAEPPAVGTPPAPETPEDFAGNIRLSKYPEELRDTLKTWANEHPDEIVKARRGVRSDAQVLEDAQRLVGDVGGDFKRLQAKWKSGDAWNAEEILALRGVLRAKTQAIIDAQKVVQTDAKLENLVKLNEAILAQAEVQEIVTGITAEAGRALRQFRQDAFEATGDAAKLEKLLERIGGKDKVKEISEALGQLDANDPVSVNNFVRNILKPGLWDYVTEIYYNSILSGPKTHIVNSLSNTFNALVSPIERVAAAAIEFPLSKIQGRPRARFFNEVPADAFGAIEGSKEGFAAWWKTMKTGISPEQASKYEIPRVRAFKGFLGRVINFPSTNLEAADSLMRQVNYRAVFNAVAKRTIDESGKTGQEAIEALAELKLNPTKELLEEAAKVSEYRLFRAPAGKFTSSIIGMRGAVNIGGFKPLTFIVPFVRTPVNLLKYGLERSPAGWFNPKMWDNIKKAKPEASDQIGRVMLGTLMAAAIAIYVKEGLITGAAPANEAERDRFYRDGKQPFSVRIGDNWISYQRLEPFNQAFSQVAAVMKAMQDKESDTAAKVGQIASTIGQNLVSQTYLSGLANTIDAIRQPERYGDDLLTRLATALAVPASSLTRTLAQILDPTVRQPRTLTEAIKAGIPGLSKQVPAKVTAFGEDVVRKSPAWSPVNISPVQQTVVTKELDRLEINTGFISGTIAGVILTDMERREYQRVAGKLTAERITELIEAPSYNSLSDENKERAIERTVNEARDQARKLILDSISQEEQEVRKRDGIPSKNSVMGADTASTREAEKAIEDWQPDWRLKDENYWSFSNNKNTYESLKKEDKPKWIKDNPAFVADQFLYGDRLDWKDGSYEMITQVAQRASKLGVPLSQIPAFSLTDKGKERIPTDKKLWKSYFDYNDLPSSSYLAMTQAQVDAGLLPEKYLKEWETYHSLKTDTAKDYFRKAHKEVSKGDWRDDFRRKNPDFDKWAIESSNMGQDGEGLKPLKPKTISRRSSGSTTSIRPASGVSMGPSSIRRTGGKVSYPKFKKVSVSTGMRIGAPRAPGV